MCVLVLIYLMHGEAEPKMYHQLQPTMEACQAKAQKTLRGIRSGQARTICFRVKDGKVM